MFRGIGRLRAGGGFNYVATLFASTGADGFWGDESDFSTLYQDSVGTTAVTAVGQPIGLMLDKHLGAVRGVNAAAPGTFDTTVESWLAFNTNCVISAVGGQLRVATAAAATSAFAQAFFTTVIGKWYRAEIGVSNFLGGVSFCQFFAGTASGSGDKYSSPTLTSPGTTSGYFLATSNPTYLLTNVQGTTGCSADFDNVKLQMVDGNHATQATAANRLILQQDASGFYYAAANGTNQNITTTSGGGGTTGFFFCQAINPAGSAGTARTLFSDGGTNTGYRVGINVSNQLELSAGNGTAFTAIATVATLGVGSTQLVTAWDDGTNLNVQVGGNTVASVARPTVSAGTAATTIASDNGAATGFFYGNLYPEVYFKNTGLTTAQRLQVQNYCKSKAGL
jgi:hypothetical protein